MDRQRRIPTGITTIIIAVLCTAPADAQHRLPFASSGHRIDIVIRNSSDGEVRHVAVEAAALPEWVRVTEHAAEIGLIEAHGSATASFAFDVARTAPVDETGEMIFTVRSPSEALGEKRLEVAVSPPEAFELTQNYPNPFNPATTIEFVVPQTQRVSLTVYDLLGRTIATPVNDIREAGAHTVPIDASSWSSGIYIYRLTTTATSLTRKMLLVK